MKIHRLLNDARLRLKNEHLRIEPWMVLAKHALRYRGEILAPSSMDLIGVEVGVHKGHHAKRILKHLPIAHLWLIDPYVAYEGDREFFTNQSNQSALFETVRSYFENDTRVDLVREFSACAVNQFTDENLDFVFIDGEHSYDAVIQDLELWWPKIRYRGLMVADDYKLQWPGVMQAALEFSLTHKIPTKELENGQLVFFKTSK